MKKYKFICVAVGTTLVATFLIIFLGKLPHKQCGCVVYQKFDETILHPNSTMQSHTDSLCIMSGCDNGDIITRTFKK